MGRPGAEFWDLTYREIFACITEFNDEREERHTLVGIIAASIFNAQRTSANDKVWEPGDFVNLREKTDEEQRRPPSAISIDFRRAHALWQAATGQI